MMQLVYDGSFEGFLTAVFELYERKDERAKIVRSTHYQPELGSQFIPVISDSAKALRVWTGLKKKISADTLTKFYKAFLSEIPAMEDTLLQFALYVFSSPGKVEKNFANKYVLAVMQLAKRVHREKHRMEAFIRFQQTKDDIYYSVIEPDFNVLPLIAKHFKERYADQHWIIYDKKRSYGIQYNKNRQTVNEVLITLLDDANSEFLPSHLVTDVEPVYQQLWKEYFCSVNINSRQNTKLHVRHVPTRYWKYLTEKIT